MNVPVELVDRPFKRKGKVTHIVSAALANQKEVLEIRAEMFYEVDEGNVSDDSQAGGVGCMVHAEYGCCYFLRVPLAGFEGKPKGTPSFWGLLKDNIDSVPQSPAFLVGFEGKPKGTPIILGGLLKDNIDSVPQSPAFLVGFEGKLKGPPHHFGGLLKDNIDSVLHFAILRVDCYTYSDLQLGPLIHETLVLNGCEHRQAPRRSSFEKVDVPWLTFAAPLRNSIA